MTDLHHRAKELFLEARALPDAQRPAWLERACDGDAALREEVESLLATAEGMPDSYLTPFSEIGLAPGSTLAHYRIRERLGAGGMGEVYGARDSDLDRDVAIKVLPRRLAEDPDRLARLRREAKVLASLNHPNIGAVHGLVEDAGVRGIVLELVQGPTLAERLQQGPVPLDAALAVARQICDALDAAHEKGVVHRDLKPANVKLRPDGTVKVLDFGLAKAVTEDGEGAGGSRMPTGTAEATREGLILGTPGYMSPEQARGQPIDRRTDIWAFGCVLYELLTARAAFSGESAPDILAAVLGRDPDWSALPTATPLAVRRLLGRCLEKDPKRRLRDIGDARIEIDDALRGSDAEPYIAAEHAAEDGRAARDTKLRRAALAGVMLAAIAAAVAAWAWFGRQARAPAESVRVAAQLPPGVRVTTGTGTGGSSVALSPNGRTLVIAGSDADGRRLYVRSLDRLEATPLPGTEGGVNPFFSPDGEAIGFIAEGWLRRISTGGGAAVDIARMPGSGFPAGASWGPDERIVFGVGARGPLFVVSAHGGDPESLTTLDREAGESSHTHPDILPDGRTMLFDAGGSSGISVHAFDLRTGARTPLVRGDSPRYAASGHLIFTRGTTLLAAPFDPSRLRLTGTAVQLVEGVADLSGYARHYAISGNGTLAYVPAAERHALVLRDAGGIERLISEEAWAFENPQFSPDGRRLAVATSRRRGDGLDIWIHDLEAAGASKLTSDGGRAPLWTPDGTQVTFSHLGDRQGIYTKPVDGSANAEQLLAIDEFHWLIGWTPNGRTLAYGTMEGPAPDGLSRSSIMAYADGKRRRVIGPGPIWGGRLSPDGRWLVYYTGEPPQFEVLATPFPNADAEWLIAEDGRDPSWSPDGSEIYYRSGDRLMAARVDTTGGVRVLSRRLAVEPFLPPLYDDYDVHPDGRLVMVRPVGDAQGLEVTIVLNWFTELRRLVR